MGFTKSEVYAGFRTDDYSKLQISSLKKNFDPKLSLAVP